MKIVALVLVAACFFFTIAFDRISTERFLNIVLAETKATCNQQPLLACSQAFLNNFGFNNTFPSAALFADALSDYYENFGLAAWNNIKTWEGQMVQCIGGQANWDACMTVANIQQAYGVDHNEAVRWTLGFLQIAYEVGPGYAVLTANWYCIKQTEEHMFPFIGQCYEIYNNATVAHPHQGCENLVDLLDCLTLPYSQSCGAQVGTFVGNLEKITYHVSAPSCESHLALKCK